MSIIQYSMGVARINDLMVRMAEAVEAKDKEKLMELGTALVQDSEDFVAVMLENAEITEEDLETFSKTHEEGSLIKLAGSAEDMQSQARDMRIQQQG
jgi:hypothetical protein